MFKKNLYASETAVPQAIFVLIFMVICFGLALIGGANLNPFIIGFFILVIGFDCYALKKALEFCQKRDKALEQPVYSAGVIIGKKNIYRYKRTPRAILYIQLDNGDILSTPEMWRTYSKKIVSPNVNVYKYEDFLYVGDIQLKSQRGEIAINIPKM
jgi:hypothetical protein